MICLAAARCFVFTTHISLDLFNAELFKSTNGGCDGQQGSRSLKVSAYFGGAFVNNFNCRFALICVALWVNRGSDTKLGFLIQKLIFVFLFVQSYF